MPARTACRRSKLGIRTAIAATALALSLTSSGIALAQKPMCHALGTRDLVPPDKLPAPEKLAGIGNVFKSELCFACNVNPFRKVATLSITELTCLVSTARKYLQANVTDNSGDQIVTHTGLRRTTGRADREENLWVYKRHNEPCRKCGTRIERRKQAPSARTTFWCPTCQPQRKNSPQT